MTIKVLKIDPEFAGLIPPLTQEEHEQLERNLLEDGCLDSLVVWHDTLVDGHNRYDICQKHGMEFHVTNINQKTRDDVITWIILHQLGRRNLSDFVRVELALRIKPILDDRAKARINKGISNPSQISDEGRTDQKIADAAHVSRDTVRKVEAIKKNGASVLVAATKADEISINKAAKIAKLPKAQQAKAMAEPKNKKAKPAKPVDEFPPNMAEALQQADDQIRAQQELIDSLKKSDLAAEVIKWRDKFERLEGRLRQCMTTKTEAEKQAKYSTALLAKIRKALKVEKNTEILEAIRQ